MGDHHDANTVAASTSWDEATLISEAIMALTLAILELCLSEGIS